MERLCDICHTHPATFHYRENRDGVKKEMHLCAHCAGEKGIGIKEMFSVEPMAPFSLFSAKSPSFAGESICPVCRTSLAQIRKRGVFGCAGCFDAFASRLDMTPFVGKGYQGERLVKKEEQTEKPDEKKEETIEESLAALRDELKRAVAEENYEKAATLRDEIRKKEGK